MPVKIGNQHSERSAKKNPLGCAITHFSGFWWRKIMAAPRGIDGQLSTKRWRERAVGGRKRLLIDKQS
jgi:hypothetical protein